MGFTIELRAPNRQSPERDNLELAANLRQTFPSLADFPLDHDLIAREYTTVPRDDVLNHWAQLELHADETLGNAIVTIWLSAAYIELPSIPAESCEARLVRIEPVLGFFVTEASVFRPWPNSSPVTKSNESVSKLWRV